MHDNVVKLGKRKWRVYKVGLNIGQSEVVACLSHVKIGRLVYKYGVSLSGDRIQLLKTVNTKKKKAIFVAGCHQIPMDVNTDGGHKISCDNCQRAY